MFPGVLCRIPARVLFGFCAADVPTETSISNTKLQVLDSPYSPMEFLKNHLLSFLQEFLMMILQELLLGIPLHITVSSENRNFPGVVSGSPQKVPYKNPSEVPSKNPAGVHSIKPPRVPWKNSEMISSAQN